MIRSCRTKEYNWDFDTETGYFQRWGKVREDDPSYSPYGPEILDMEISTTCHGTNDGPCSFCYKGNAPNGKQMSVEQFQTILAKIPRNLTQIAFGIGDLDGHPDLEKILGITKREGITPNITINGFRTSCNSIKMVAIQCGSIAVSRYDRDICYDTVHRLTVMGAQQVNIHQVVSPNTIQECLNLIEDAKSDTRLKNLNAVVFLMMKPKGRAVQASPVAMEQFKLIVDKALRLEIPFGFDSCSAPSFLKAIEGHERFEEFTRFIEPCEAFLFSSYCNVDGEFFPCSFCEGETGWETGLPVTGETDFLPDIWNHERMIEWRSRLTNSSKACSCSVSSVCRSCPVFSSVSICKSM